MKMLSITKIGKESGLVSSRANLERNHRLVYEIVKEFTPIPTSISEDEVR